MTTWAFMAIRYCKAFLINVVNWFAFLSFSGECCRLDLSLFKLTGLLKVPVNFSSLPVSPMCLYLLTSIYMPFKVSVSLFRHVCIYMKHDKSLPFQQPRQTSCDLWVPTSLNPHRKQPPSCKAALSLGPAPFCLLFSHRHGDAACDSTATQPGESPCQVELLTKQIGLVPGCQEVVPKVLQFSFPHSQVTGSRANSTGTLTGWLF